MPISWGDVDWYNLGRGGYFDKMSFVPGEIKMPVMFRHGERVLECPCCKGRGYLIVHGPQFGLDWSKTEHHPCTHCMGKGTIPDDECRLRYFGEIPL